MSSKKSKKSLQIISGKRLAALIKGKVARMEDFSASVGWTRQYINTFKKKEKVRIAEEQLEKIKNYLNITLEEIAYVPRETESKQNGTKDQGYPVSSSILEELEACRKDVIYWRGLAREYEAELNRLRAK